MIGQKIGQYRVLERLGTGGMGSVYRAVDETLGREVALKVRETTMEDSSARFRAEGAALARLSHPGIATVYELVEDDARLVMAMELVRGRTLQDLLGQVGVLAPRRAAELCMQALVALEHAHNAGVVHRDLKPGNLMITESASIKIMDFGIARLDGTINLTLGGTTLGTPAYMAPEQVLGHPIDARTDLYAMGVVFFRLITGALPFKGDTPFDMAQSQVQDAPPKASDVNGVLPPWVDDILTRALAKKPADRFQSAMEFHEAFARAIADAPSSSVVPSVEATEVMARPDLTQAAAAPPRPPRTVWLTPRAAVVLAAAVWILIETASSHGPASPTPAYALTNSEPAPALQASAAAKDIPRAQPATKVANASPVRSTRSTSTSPEKALSRSALAPASFSDVKFLAVNGSHTSASDAVVHFSDVEVSVQPPNGQAAAAVLSYQQIAKATYAHGRDPKWDPALSGPAQRVNVPGILGRARHWLVLQSAESYLILRLDGDDRLEVMKALEERAGIVIDRSAGGKRPE
jgi:serine/threonine protein kinase